MNKEKVNEEDFIMLQKYGNVIFALVVVSLIVPGLYYGATHTQPIQERSYMVSAQEVPIETPEPDPTIQTIPLGKVSGRLIKPSRMTGKLPVFARVNTDKGEVSASSTLTFNFPKRVKGVMLKIGWLGHYPPMSWTLTADKDTISGNPEMIPSVESMDARTITFKVAIDTKGAPPSLYKAELLSAIFYQ